MQECGHELSLSSVGVVDSHGFGLVKHRERDSQSTHASHSTAAF